MTTASVMMAAVFEGEGSLKVRQIPIPTIANPDDVLIRVEACSICGSDVRALAVPPEFIYVPNIIIGHEYCGIVEEKGSAVTSVDIGDRVVVHPNLWCGKCYYCRTGQTNLCSNITHLGNMVDGGMSEYSIVPERLVYKISKSVPAHVACLAEPLACVLNATGTVRVHPGENVVVLGAGPIGLIFACLYKAAGANVIVSEISEFRSGFARRVGADLVINPATEDLVARVCSETLVGADLVVDAVGVLLPEALRLVRKGGQIVLFGLNEKTPVELNQSSITFREVTVRGTYIAKGTFPMAVQLLEKQTLPIEHLITHRLRLNQCVQGFELMRDGSGIKVVIEPF